MSGRTNDPLAKMTAERDEAIRRFEASEKLEKEAIKQRGKEYRRAERYKNELKTLKHITGVAGGDSVISEIESSSMWSKEAITTRNWLKRFAPTDVPEVVARALAGLKDENGRSVLHMIADCDAFTDVKKQIKKQIIRERDEQIHNHLRDVVLAPRKCELARLLLRVSWRKTRWLTSLFKWNWAYVNEEGEREKKRHMLAPDSEQPVPDIFPIKQMRSWETTKLSGAAGNVAHTDGKGSESKSVDWAILAAIKAADVNAGMGGMATKGTEDDPHWMILTGDGAGLTEAESGVRIAVCVGSVRKLNQSMHAIYNLVFYKADENAESYETIMARCANVRPQLCRIFKEGQCRNEDGSLSGIHVKFMLSADKPFIMKALGRKNMNYDHFSHSCDCADKDLYKLDFDTATHYMGITFQQRCSRALVPLHEALEMPEPEDWTVTDVKGKVWTKAEVLTLRRDVDCMDEPDLKKFLETWARENFGQEFGKYPALPYHDVCIDYLHAYINEFNGANAAAAHARPPAGRRGGSPQARQSAGRRAPPADGRCGRGSGRGRGQSSP